jgi:hypothetical protein
MQIQQQSSDGLYGAAALTAGGSGLTIQVVTEWASLTVMIINIALALVGLYLAWRQIKGKK